MIYIHIPFCRKKCSYCNFHFSTFFKLKSKMIQSLYKELEIRTLNFDNPIESIYFGGGTPSVLTIDEIEKFLNLIQKKYQIASDVEITLEANPDDLNLFYLKDLKKIGVNRLSIGVQSFDETELIFMNRSHNSIQAQKSIENAQNIGLENISIDLIYGSPYSNDEIIKKNIELCIKLNIPHISAYALTVESKTALENWIRLGKINSLDEKKQNEMFYLMAQILKENEYIHYEISNFSKKNNYSKHNSSYWKYKSYLGIGPSAHSYNGNEERSWNISNNQKYITAIENGILPLTTEILSEKDQYNEMIMIGLRTIWGVDLQKINQKFSDKIKKIHQKNIEKKLNDGTLIIEENHLKIPSKYWFYADGIASDLFII